MGRAVLASLFFLVAMISTVSAVTDNCDCDVMFVVDTKTAIPFFSQVQTTMMNILNYFRQAGFLGDDAKSQFYMSIINMNSGTPLAAAQPTKDYTKLSATISALAQSATGTTTQARSAFTLAAALRNVRPTKCLRVVIFSDGVWDDYSAATALKNTNTRLYFIAITRNPPTIDARAKALATDPASDYIVGTSAVTSASIFSTTYVCIVARTIYTLIGYPYWTSPGTCGNNQPALSWGETFSKKCTAQCLIGDWTAFGTCSVTCGSGKTTRSRSLNGNCGTTPKDETQPCNTFVCPVDCVMGDWSPLSSCSKSCGGGTQTRTRSIKTAQVGTGKACLATSETVNCNTLVCLPDNPYCDCDIMFVVDSSTSLTKQNFQSLKNFLANTISGYAGFLGDDLKGNILMSLVSFNSKVMSVPFTSDGNSLLDKAYNGMTQLSGSNMAIALDAALTLVNNHANACHKIFIVSDGKVDSVDAVKASADKLKKDINTHLYAIAMGTSPNMQVMRDILDPKAVTVATYTALENYATNVTKMCADACLIGDWSDYDACDKACGTGSKYRYRIMSGNCKGVQDEDWAKCNTQPCAVDCKLGEWAAWGDCDAKCGGGQKTRTRPVTTPATNGGKICDVTRQSMPCNTDGCPVNCELGEWTDWQLCSVSCGGGSSIRSRPVITPVANGGVACGQTAQSKDCNSDACPTVATNDECDCDLMMLVDNSPSVGKEDRKKVIQYLQNTGDGFAQFLGPNFKANINMGLISFNAKATLGFPDGLSGNLDDYYAAVDNLAGSKAISGSYAGLAFDLAGTIFAKRPSKCKKIVILSDGKYDNMAGAHQSIAALKKMMFGPFKNMTVRIQAVAVGTSTNVTSLKITATNPQTDYFALENYDQLQEWGTNMAEKCKAACLMDDWQPWDTCTVPCGNGTQYRWREWSGGCTDADITEEYRPCNTFECNLPCVMSPWGNWTKCTTSCGGGTQTHTRTIISQPTYGGTPCGPTTDTLACMTTPCPVDCIVADWGIWSACDKTCGGGISTRTRQILIAAANGGKVCNTTAETKTCNTNNCPVDCELGEWADWGACDKSCGTGNQIRSRQIKTNVAWGGKTCGATSDTQNCNTKACPIDCVVSAWTPFTDCDKSCGGGSKQRTRTIDVQPQFGGAVCPATKEVVSCNTPACPVDCVMGAWSAFGACSLSCGTGTQVSTRTVSTPPAFGGQPCPVSSKSQPCNTQLCPIDCVLTNFTGWQKCDKSCGGGTMIRERTIAVPPSNGGKPCDELKGTSACNTQPCPIDCVVKDWDNWSDCTATCGGGTRTRSRGVATPAMYGGADCPGTTQIMSCHPDPCPIDCELGSWDDWSLCDRTCGGGSQSRQRTVKVQSQFGGAPCPVVKEVNVCATEPCAVDCVMSEWGTWSTCDKSCGTGAQVRSRTVQVDSAHGGVACAHTQEKMDCNTDFCPIDCVVGNYSDWTACDVSCGGGTQIAQREIKIPPRFGGSECPDLKKFQACNTKPCPVDCIMKSWSPWSECDKTCGGGVETRVRSVNIPAANGGTACPVSIDQQPCNSNPCPIDCVVGAWGPWGKCSKTCGIGSYTRERNITVAPQFGGLTCLPLSETSSCNTDPCPVDAVLSSWGNWSTCDKSCGTGAQERGRSIVIPAAFGGAEAGHLQETQKCNDQPCPIDCILEDWTQWSVCTATCGGGSQKRSRAVKVAPQYGGVPCLATADTQACNTFSCPVDCVLDKWTEFSTCDKTCGGGRQTRTRAVAIAPAFGGLACAATAESQDCNVFNCPIDCVVGNWTNWGQCTKTCGGGTHTHSRPILTEHNYGGTKCPTTFEMEACSTEPCPIDCEVSKWSEWADCSVSCGGGTQSRSRNITIQAANGGATCPAISESQTCNTAPCPIDCVLNPWDSWGNCDKTCGNGTQLRFRSIKVQPQNGGLSCPELSEVQNCQTQACPIDCVMSDWTEWILCTKSCGGGIRNRTRTVTVASAHGGKECLATSEQMTCNTLPCPIDAEVSEWSSWGECSRSCGGGEQQRTRTVTKVAQYGGLAPPVLSQMQPCKTQQCAVDCVVGDWSAWETCTKTCGGGVHNRTRPIVKASAFGGKDCASTWQQENCNTDPCPVDCIMEEWTSWAPCDKSCGTGKQFRSREIKVPAAYNGTACPTGRHDRICNTNDCPIDCVVSDWGDYEVCDKTCGGGNKLRRRTVTVSAKFNGTACPSLVESTTCNTFSCPIDCVVGNWTVWGTCSKTCGTGQQTRTRPILVLPLYAGIPCPSLNETQDCNTPQCPIDCEVDPWSDWTQCSASCGTGSQQATRTIKTAAKFGGKACPDLTKTQKCNTNSCPIDCVMSSFTDWGKCSVSCGGGIQTRSRKVTTAPQFGGQVCPPSEESQSCNILSCPVDCVVSKFGDWAACTKTCGGGTKTRTATVTVAQAFGGKDCTPTSETASCNTDPCPVDCVLGDWSTWGNCDVTCGGGSQKRTRSVITAAANNGKLCDATTETQKCNTDPCPVDCQQSSWTDWSVCSATCGGKGTQQRQRTVTVAAANGGKVCGPSSEVQPCNTPACPIDCELGEWGSFDACTKTCGTGTNIRTRPIKVNTANGGKSCGQTVDQQVCNTNPCPINCVLSDWSAFGQCSKTCGGGQRIRTRNILVAPAYGGTACAATTDSQSCNPDACDECDCEKSPDEPGKCPDGSGIYGPANCIMDPSDGCIQKWAKCKNAQDCVLGDWSQYSACTVTCNGGRYTRTRQVIKPALYGGDECGVTQETRTCNTQSCKKKQVDNDSEEMTSHHVHQATTTTSVPLIILGVAVVVVVAAVVVVRRRRSIAADSMYSQLVSREENGF